MEAIKTLASFHITLARVLATHTFTYKESDIYANKFNKLLLDVSRMQHILQS